MKTLPLRNVAATMVAVALGIGSTSAIAEVLRCDGCTFGSAESRAVASGMGDRLVLDFTDGDIWQFSVVVDPDAHRIFGQPPPLMAVDVGLSSDDVQEFQDIAQLWRSNGGSLKLNYELRPGDPLYPPGFTGFSARDITWSVQARESVGRSVATRDFPGAAGRLAGILQGVMIEAARVVVGDAQLRIIVIFPDGSSGVFVIDQNHTTQAKFEFGSARDSEGNIVPDQSHVEGQPNHLALVGQHRFTQDQNLADWLQRARQLGIPVSDRRERPSDRPMVVECTVRDGRVDCVARYIGL